MPSPTAQLGEAEEQAADREEAHRAPVAAGRPATELRREPDHDACEGGTRERSRAAACIRPSQPPSRCNGTDLLQGCGFRARPAGGDEWAACEALYDRARESQLSGGGGRARRADAVPAPPPRALGTRASRSRFAPSASTSGRSTAGRARDDRGDQGRAAALPPAGERRRRRAPGPRSARSAGRSSGPGRSRPATSASTSRCVQYLLSRDGAYHGALDGYVGRETEAAVRRYQRRASLASTGWSGPSPLSALERAPAAPPEPSPATEMYVVQPGDSLTAIASRYGLTLTRLATINRLDPGRVLLVGTHLAIPAKLVERTRSPRARSTCASGSTAGPRASASPSRSSARSRGWSRATSPASSPRSAPVGCSSCCRRPGPSWRTCSPARPIPPTLDGDIEVGVLVLRHLLDQFGGDERLALAGWYQGEAAVKKYGHLQGDEAVRRRRARARSADVTTTHVTTMRSMELLDRPRRVDGRGPDAARRASRPARDLQPEGLRAADEALPRRLPLLHVRPPAAPRRARVHVDRRGARGRPRW